MSSRFKLLLSDVKSTRGRSVILLILLPFSLPLPIVVSSVLIILLLINSLLSAEFPRALKAAFRYKPFLLLIALYLIEVVGMLYTSDLSHGSFILTKKLPLIILPLVVFTLPSLASADVHKVLKSFLAACAVPSVYLLASAAYRSIIDSAEGIDSNYFTARLLEPLALHYPYFGLWQAFCFFIAAYFLFFNRQKNSYYKLIYGILMILSFVMILLLTAKMALLAVAAVSVLMLLRFIDLKKYALHAVVAFTVMIGACILLYTQVPFIRARVEQGINYSSFNNIENNRGNYASTRMAPLKCSLDLIGQYWLTGTGTGDAQHAMDACYDKSGLSDLKGFDNHNQYFKYFVTFGITGLLLFLGVLLSSFIKAFREKDFLYTAFIGVFAVCSLTECLLEVNKGIIFFALFSSVLAFYARQRQTADR